MARLALVTTSFVSSMLTIYEQYPWSTIYCCIQYDQCASHLCIHLVYYSTCFCFATTSSLKWHVSWSLMVELGVRSTILTRWYHLKISDMWKLESVRKRGRERVHKRGDVVENTSGRRRKIIVFLKNFNTLYILTTRLYIHVRYIHLHWLLSVGSLKVNYQPRKYRLSFIPWLHGSQKVIIDSIIQAH
jgi:hypothetical protein